MTMDPVTMEAELKRVIAEHGERPFGFFSILQASGNPNLDLQAQNKGWEFIKLETWHSLDLTTYILWAISDNGDLLWWNGEQTIAMNPRDATYISEPVSPSLFIRLARLGKVGRPFPTGLESTQQTRPAIPPK